MKRLSTLLSALLVSASPAFAELDRDNNCIRNKESEIQRWEKHYQTGYQWVLISGNVSDIARQMEEAGKFPKDFTSKEKYDAAYKLVTDQLRQMKKSIEALKTYPDCSALQGDKGQ